MTDRTGLVVAVVALSLVCAVTVALVVAIRRDGRGHRPPPGGTLVGRRHHGGAAAVRARIARLAVGLVAYAVSIALVVRSGLGSMPWDVLHQGIAAHSGLSFGAVTA